MSDRTPSSSPIETMYAGTLFRSRLEARWAVFFDNLGIKWQFEPQGFEVGPRRRRYLPDFLLPDLNIWVEVKGAEDALDRSLLSSAIDYGAGLPHVGCMAYWSGDENLGGLLVLGPIPRPREHYIPAHALLQHHKGTVLQGVPFHPGGIHRMEKYDEFFGDGESVAYQGPVLELGWGWSPPPSHPYQRVISAVNAAYVAARSARFEHDQRETWGGT